MGAFHMLGPVGTLLGAAIWIWGVIEMFRRGHAWPWLLAAFFFGPVGALIYLAVVVVPDMLPARRPKAGPRLQLAQAEIEVKRLDNAPAWRDLAEARRAKGRHEEALAAAEQAFAKDPEDPHIAWELAQCRIAAGRAAAAIEPLDIALAKDRGFAAGAALHALAVARRGAGDAAGALAALRELGARTSRPEFLYSLAQAEAEVGEVSTARALLQRIVDEGSLVPRYLAGEVRPWIRKANRRLAELPA